MAFYYFEERYLRIEIADCSCIFCARLNTFVLKELSEVLPFDCTLVAWYLDEVGCCCISDY